MHHKTVVLLLNLGTPQAPTRWAILRYLREFLQDRRVVDLPALLRYPLLYGLILPLRSAKTTAAYQKIWGPQGSPLRAHLMQLQTALQTALAPQGISVQAAMRYGTPDFKSVLEKIKMQCEHLIILPLFPQYASSTTGSALEAILTQIATWDYIPQISTSNHFYNIPGFGALIGQKILQHYDPALHDCVLLSYHSLPLKALPKVQCHTYHHCTKTLQCPPHARCYRAQCLATSLQIQAQLPAHLPVFNAFQSKIGKTPWIEPSTTQILKQLQEQGFKHPLVACPSFVADCIETLEEIELRLRATWLALGGTELSLVPCLNTDPAWIQWLKDYCLTLA